MKKEERLIRKINDLKIQLKNFSICDADEEAKETVRLVKKRYKLKQEIANTDKDDIIGEAHIFDLEEMIDEINIKLRSLIQNETNKYYYDKVENLIKKIENKQKELEDIKRKKERRNKKNLKIKN